MYNLFEYTKQPFELVDINKIKPEIEYDPEYCTIKVLKMDIEKNGLNEPLLVRREHKSIKLGNQRYAVLKLLNIDKVPVRYVS